MFKCSSESSALLLVGDLRKTSDHSLDSGFIPCSGPPWIPLCLVKRTLSTLLRFLLDHQEAPTESALPHCPRLATISPLADRPTRIVSLTTELASLYPDLNSPCCFPFQSDGLPGNFAPCTFHKLLINSLNVSLFECSLHVGQIGLKNNDTKRFRI
ncbi:hypothetical protein XENOCAPTIV_010114 [Xenoophorus captivus]|uniref:Uncharacterized protein n=1 Tax=Xenoophorus captivus TaxID=1517983 RepID=A0ABV0S0N4_9TELE